MKWSGQGMFLWIVVTATGCVASNHTERGAMLGALGGGGVGAALGELAGDGPLAGAALGSAMGALTGASLGADADTREAMDAAVEQASYAQAPTLSLNDVVAMTRAGLGEEVIRRQIDAQGFVTPLATADLIHLRQQGVPDSLIAFLQERSSVQAAPAAAPAVVVAEPPPYVYPLPPWRYRRGVPCPPGPRFHWGFSLGQ